MQKAEVRIQQALTRARLVDARTEIPDCLYVGRCLPAPVVCVKFRARMRYSLRRLPGTGYEIGSDSRQSCAARRISDMSRQRKSGGR
jgi:hypothetical protein